MRFDNRLAKECQRTMRARARDLRSAAVSDRFDVELYIIERILKFPFSKYPDYTAPWHLLTWPHMRWDHVYNLITILESLKQPTGSHVGEPMVLQPFQIMIILAFLGPENPDTGLRIVKEGLLTLSRKQGKTALVSGLVTALMSIRPEDHGLKGQEIQVGASDRDQAGITHSMCERFVHLDTDLGIGNKFRSVPSKKQLTHLKTLTQLRCLSSDAHRHHGGNPAIVLLDEIGNVSNAAAEEFYSVLTTGFGTQDEPLTLLFSTQAPTDQHFFSQQVDRAKRINEGMLPADSFAGFVFTVPEVDEDENDVDPFDESLWYLAAPGLDTIYNRADLKDWAKRARELPSLQNKFELLKLNRRVSETASFLSRRVWEKNNASFDIEQLYGNRAWLGIDLAETTDLASLVALIEYPDESIEEMRFAVHPHFWIPGEDLQGRVHRDKVPYDVWAREGLIDVDSPKVVEYSRIAARIVELLSDFDVQAIGFDRWKMKYLLAALKDLGHEWAEEEEFLIPIGQGFQDANRSVELLEGLALKEQLAHGNHPILKWNVGNTVTKSDPAGNRKFEKGKSYGRIDGCVALAIAAHARDRKLMQPGPAESMYNDASRTMIM